MNRRYYLTFSPLAGISLDEINRGNISRIFGELITLLETSKRSGAEDQRVVVLPYSKTRFSVPGNLYLIGTMNTADKSLTEIDLALRRRFEFVEMPPDTRLFSDLKVYDVSIQRLIETMNSRIEVLLDKDHLLGHAYFLPLFKCETETEKKEQLANLFKRQIIPLLQEYFYNDIERVSWVLNDSVKPKAEQFIHFQSSPSVSALFPSDVQEKVSDRRMILNEQAFKMAGAYKGILS